MPTGHAAVKYAVVLWRSHTDCDRGTHRRAPSYLWEVQNAVGNRNWVACGHPGALPRFDQALLGKQQLVALSSIFIAKGVVVLLVFPRPNFDALNQSQCTL